MTCTAAEVLAGGAAFVVAMTLAEVAGSAGALGAVA